MIGPKSVVSKQKCMAYRKMSRKKRYQHLFSVGKKAFSRTNICSRERWTNWHWQYPDLFVDCTHANWISIAKFIVFTYQKPDILTWLGKGVTQRILLMTLISLNKAWVPSYVIGWDSQGLVKSRVSCATTGL